MFQAVRLAHLREVVVIRAEGRPMRERIEDQAPEGRSWRNTEAKFLTHDEPVPEFGRLGKLLLMDVPVTVEK